MNFQNNSNLRYEILLHINRSTTPNQIVEHHTKADWVSTSDKQSPPASKTHKHSSYKNQLDVKRVKKINLKKLKTTKFKNSSKLSTSFIRGQKESDNHLPVIITTDPEKKNSLSVVKDNLDYEIAPDEHIQQKVNFFITPYNKSMCLQKHMEFGKTSMTQDEFLRFMNGELIEESPCRW